MTQASATAIRTGLGPEAEPAPQAEEPALPRASLRLTIPLLLAAGWGALLTFSVMFLMEDGRSAIAAAPERAAERAGAQIGAQAGMPFGSQGGSQDGSDEAAPFAPAAGRPREPERTAAAGAIRLVSASQDAVAAPGPASVAPAPRSAGMPAERPNYIGTWGPTAQACGQTHRRGFLPATITEASARAGRTLCRFRNGHRDGIAWAMAADCSERGRRWTSQVRLLVDGDHLTWTSAKGAATYVRCGRRDG